MNANLNIPNGYDEKVIQSWIPKGADIMKEMDNEGNYCIAYEDGEEFGFVRFFVLGGATQCSVDFQAHSLESMKEKLIDILEEKFSY